MRPVTLAIAILVTCLTWPLATALWLVLGQKALAVSVFGLGLSLGPCLAGYALVRKARKQAWRRLVLFTGGLSIMVFSVLGRASVDLEGFFMHLLTGTVGAAVGHTLVTLIVGPLVFGRFLCGWGCWRAMVLELLPIGRSAGRRGGLWRILPLAGLAASIGSAALAAFVLGERPGGLPGTPEMASLTAIAAGFVVYYVSSIGLAFGLRDQRAFCKYLCPSSAILRVTSRLSLVKMATRKELCDGCGACSRVCPMDIRVAWYAEAGRRVTTGDCILCQRCAHACPKGALGLSFGLDVGGRTPFTPFGPAADPGRARGAV
jgi:polyferredoxin